MNLIQLTIKGISYSQTQSGAYALVLAELNGSNTLPVIIGEFEAQSIAIALENDIKPPRPLTHDLFKTFADTFFVEVVKVEIYKLVDGVFFSKLICEQSGRTVTLDARTSDAIALAVRFDAPIYTTVKIIDQAGIFLKGEKEEVDDLGLRDYDVELTVEEDMDEELFGYSGWTIEKLNLELDKAVENEDYEKAAEIRDEINKRD